MRQKPLSVHGYLGDFSFIFCEYAKSILVCMENTLVAYKNIMRIRHEYKSVPYMENTSMDIKLSSANLRQKVKKTGKITS